MDLDKKWEAGDYVVVNCCTEHSANFGREFWKAHEYAKVYSPDDGEECPTFVTQILEIHRGPST